ncbi:MAG: hypothetical protein ACRKGH_01675 [Dehalogenimonas sp.]
MRYWQLQSSVQSCSNDKHRPPGGTEITRAEYDAFIAALPPPPPAEPIPDPIAELAAKVAKLETDVATIKAAK